MKTFICCILIFLFSSYIYSHEQPVHQHIVKEAWNLLKISNSSYNNIELNNWIGNNETDGPWSLQNQGRVVAGAWREDDEDVIWNYGCPALPPPINVWQYSSTHFWNVDQGPEFQHTISTSECQNININCGAFPNAYQKIQKYQGGGWTLKRDFNNGNVTTVQFQRWDGNGTVSITSYGPIGFRYEGLTEGARNLYATGFMEIVGYTTITGAFTEIAPIQIKTLNNKYYTYEILGRMCHLLGDMGVPAHVHIDTHPDPCGFGDSYETHMLTQYSNYTGANTYSSSGPFINPFNKPLAPLQYLMTIMAQTSDMFPSNDKLGNSVYDHFSDMPPYHGLYLPLSIFSHYGNNGMSQANFEIFANYCMKYDIRTTAGLLYWFVTTTNQTAPVISGITYNLPDKHINLGETGIFTCYPNVPGYTYTWERVNCSGEIICNANIPGVEETRIGNQYRIANNNYTTTYCDNYTSSCGGHSDVVPMALEFYIKVIASNGHGQTTMYYSQDSKISPTIVHRQGGCPYLYVQNNEGQFISDNNILHKSEFSENVGLDISDKYLLNVKPGIIDDKISLNLFETTQDISSINSIKLYAVDHPVGTKIGVTEENDIVMYYEDDAESPKNASKNHIEDITRYVQYNTGSSDRHDTVSGVSNDDIISDFDLPTLRAKLQASKNKFSALGRNFHGGSSYNTALIMKVGMNPDVDRPSVPVSKSDAGIVNLTVDGAEFSSHFARRESPSLVIIPFGQDATIEKANIEWYRDFNLYFASVVNISSDGFEVTELPLSQALDVSGNSIFEQLQDIDGNYSTLDTSGTIMLKFNTQSFGVNNGMIRDYVIETNGQYSNGQSGNMRAANHLQVNSKTTSTAIENTNALTNKLSANFPNPFNPTTKINYQIKKDGFVSLKIYNVIGQLVKELVGEYKNAGNYIVEFNGSYLSSGTYYYRIESNDFIETKKMILIK